MGTIRLIIGLTDSANQEILERVQYLATTELEPFVAQRRIDSLLAALKNDGYIVKTYRHADQLIMMVTLLDTIGETDPNVYVEKVKSFSTALSMFPESSNPHGFVIGTTDHSGISLDRIMDLLGVSPDLIPFIAEGEHQSEAGAGDDFSQFLIGLAVDLTARGVAAIVNRIRKALGDQTARGLVSTTFSVAALMRNLSRHSGIDTQHLQIIEMEKMGTGHYRFLVLSHKMIYHVRCDGRANILSVAEDVISLPRKSV